MDDKIDSEISSDIADDDANMEVSKLLDKIKLLESEKHQTREEFGHQRAKMKELYLHKDEEVKCLLVEQNKLLANIKKLSSELDEAKSQLVVAGFQLESDLEIEKRKCQEEIASLQQLVQETVEESSSSRCKFENDVKHLRRENKRLEANIQELRCLQQQGPSDKVDRDAPIMAPGVMLSAVTKTLARKVVSQLGADASATSQDNLEDSMRKVNKYAQEDAEVLRSLVIPLEEEIQALKEKLRFMDQELRRYQSDKDEASKLLQDETLDRELSPGNRNTTNELTEVSLVIKEDSASTQFNQSLPIVNSDLLSSPKANSANSSATSSSLNESHLGNSKPGLETHSPLREDHAKSLTDSLSEKEGDGPSSPLSQQSGGKSAPCDMCSNYEAQLVRAQQRSRELEKTVSTLERTVDRYRDDLTKESTFRKDMEDKWNEKKDEHKVQVSELKRNMETGEKGLQELRHTYTQIYTEVMGQLASLSHQREEVQEQLIKLQKENDNLVGKHSMHSEQLQNELINLPNTIQGLQEFLLNLREELIQVKVAKEAVEDQEQTLKCEIQLIREQMKVEQEGRESMEDSLTYELNTLKTQLHFKEREHHKQSLALEKLEATVAANQIKITELECRLMETLKIKKQLDDTVSDLRSRVGSLQQELDNSEAVQKDFVRLSQSLQVQLEKIRDTDTQVRWQHDEDVEECPNCRTNFSLTRKKQHCRHCGHVFCLGCLSHTVLSGPSQRPSRVCDVCHTLLVRDTAPYFSTEPPHTPD